MQNLDITDFVLSRDGNPVPLSPSMLTGSGSQYSIDLSTVTASAGNPVLGNYVFTLNASDIKNLAGIPPASGAADSWQIIALAATTTTTLTAAPNATTGGMLVTFTASVAPSPGNLGTVTFKDNGAPITAASNIAVVGGVATFQTATLTGGTHPITADYNGATGYSASTSNTLNFVVTASQSQPQLLSVTPNAGLPAFAGAQRSRVINLTVVFDQAVQLDTNAMVLALHTNNVSFGGVAQPSGMGAVPTTPILATTDNITWTMTFAGAGTVETGTDGFSSLKDGVYDLNIDATKVHPSGNSAINMGSNSTTTFHRLFGDTNPPTATPNGASTDFAAIVNSGDNLQFRNAFNKPVGGGYQPFLDVNGDGIINSGDNLQFRNRFNKALNWRV